MSCISVDVSNFIKMLETEMEWLQNGCCFKVNQKHLNVPHFPSVYLCFHVKKTLNEHKTNFLKGQYYVFSSHIELFYSTIKLV